MGCLKGGVVANRVIPTGDYVRFALHYRFTVGLNQPVGHLIAEARPYVPHPHIRRLADVTTDFSFLSDRGVNGGAVAAGLLLLNRRLGLSPPPLSR